MKTKEKKDLQTKSIEELETILKTLKEELFSLRLEFVRRKLKNTSSILHKRKDIARVETFLKEISLADKK